MKSKKILGLSSLIILILLFSGCLGNDTLTPYLDNINTKGLVGSWSFEDTAWTATRNFTRDDSSQQNHGSAEGPTIRAPGAIGRTAAYFPADTATIIIPHHASLEPSTLSIEIWIKAANTQINTTIFAKNLNNCSQASYGLRINTQGFPYFFISNQTSTITSPTATTNIWDNSWHYLVGTYDGTTLRFYLDGTQINTGTPTTITINYNQSTHNHLIIGNPQNCSNFFEGYLDEIRVWNRALSSSEITSFYQLAQTTTLRQPHQTNISYHDLGNLIRNLLVRYQSTEIIIVKAQTLAVQDNFIFTTAHAILKDFQNIQVILDTDISSFEQLADTYKIIILLGGNETNQYTTQLLEDPDWSTISTYFATPIYLTLGTHPIVDRYIMIFYTNLETGTLENQAIEKSPLNGLLDKRVIPVVATVVSISLLYLWSIISNLLLEFFFDYTSGHLEDRKIRKHFKFFQPTVQYTGNLASTREIIGMFIAILTFSIALSWTWTEDLQSFLELFIINILIITLIYVIKESIRIHFSHKQKLHTEHIFWPFGALITIGSTILGNTFSLASYTILQDEDDIKEYGHMYYRIFIILFVITWVLFLINLFYPSVILQMLYVFTIMSVVIDMTPVNPMDGKDVKTWNARRWTILYIFVILTYISINFANLLYL